MINKVILFLAAILSALPSYAQTVYGTPNVVSDTGFIRILASGRAISLTASQLAAQIGAGTVSDGDKGDLTITGSGTVWTIDNLAVTNAKIADLNVSKLLSGTLPSGLIFTVPAASSARFDYVGGNPALVVSTSANETSLFSQDGSQYLSTNNTNVLIGSGTSKLEYSGGNLAIFDSDATQSVTVKTPVTGLLTTSYTLTLPVDDGTTGQVLQTDGTGITSWNTPAGAVVTISPATLTADQNDWAPTGIATATDVRVSGDASFREITGLTTGAAGRKICLHIVGSNPVGFLPKHTGSAAANRFNFPYPILVYPGNSIKFRYDDVDAVWTLEAAPNQPNDSRVNYYEMNPGSITAADHNTWASTLVGGTWATQLALATLPSSGWALGTAAVATGASTISAPKTAAVAGYFSTGWVTYTARVNLSAVSDGTNRYTAGIRIGAGVTTAGHAVNNSIGIRYVDNVNSGRWQAYTRNAAGTESVLDSGVAAGTAPISLTVQVNYLATKARFYVNGAYVGEITTNVPNAVTWGFSASILKSVGTTARTMSIIAMKGVHHF